MVARHPAATTTEPRRRPNARPARRHLVAVRRVGPLVPLDLRRRPVAPLPAAAPGDHPHVRAPAAAGACRCPPVPPHVVPTGPDLAYAPPPAAGVRRRRHPAGGHLPRTRHRRVGRRAADAGLPALVGPVLLVRTEHRGASPGASCSGAPTAPVFDARLDAPLARPLGVLPRPASPADRRAPLADAAAAGVADRPVRRAAARRPRRLRRGDPAHDVGDGQRAARGLPLPAARRRPDRHARRDPPEPHGRLRRALVRRPCGRPAVAHPLPARPWPPRCASRRRPGEHFRNAYYDLATARHPGRRRPVRAAATSSPGCSRPRCSPPTSPSYARRSPPRSSAGWTPRSARPCGRCSSSATIRCARSGPRATGCPAPCANAWTSPNRPYATPSSPRCTRADLRLVPAGRRHPGTTARLPVISRDPGRDHRPEARDVRGVQPNRSHRRRASRPWPSSTPPTPPAPYAWRTPGARASNRPARPSPVLGGPGRDPSRPPSTEAWEGVQPWPGQDSGRRRRPGTPARNGSLAGYGRERTFRGCRPWPGTDEPACGSLRLLVRLRRRRGRVRRGSGFSGRSSACDGGVAGYGESAPSMPALRLRQRRGQARDQGAVSPAARPPATEAWPGTGERAFRGWSSACDGGVAGTVRARLPRLVTACDGGVVGCGRGSGFSGWYPPATEGVAGYRARARLPRLLRPPATEAWPGTDERAVSLPPRAPCDGGMAGYRVRAPRLCPALRRRARAGPGRATGRSPCPPLHRRRGARDRRGPGFPTSPSACDGGVARHGRACGGRPPTGERSRPGVESHDTDQAVAPPSAAQARSAAEGLADRPAPPPATEVWPGRRARGGVKQHRDAPQHERERDGRCGAPTPARRNPRGVHDGRGSGRGGRPRCGRSEFAACDDGLAGIRTAPTRADHPLRSRSRPRPGRSSSRRAASPEATSGDEDPSAKAPDSSSDRIRTGRRPARDVAPPTAAHGQEREDPEDGGPASPSGVTSGADADRPGPHGSFAGPAAVHGPGHEDHETGGPASPSGVAARPVPEGHDAGGTPASATARSPPPAAGGGEPRDSAVSASPMEKSETGAPAADGLGSPPATVAEPGTEGLNAKIAESAPQASPGAGEGPAGPLGDPDAERSDLLSGPRPTDLMPDGTFAAPLTAP